MVTLILSLFLAALTVFFVVAIQGKLVENSFIGFAPGERRINVQGEGKVSVKPDVAEASIGVVTRGANVGQAQTENTRISNAIIDFIKNSGVADKDIKPINYSVQPRYDYSRFGRGELIDYEVRNTVQVKIRDFTKIGTILEGAGSRGANEVSSLQFIVDEPQKAQEEARAKAFEDAKSKAQKMAEQLGVKVGRIVNFNESPSYFPRFAEVYGKGGDGGPVVPPTPQIEPGENEVIVNVNVTYEIR